MKEIGYFFAKIKYKMQKNNKEAISKYFRKAGMEIGSGCNIMTVEPYLIHIGNDVTISTEVAFVTHDNSINKVDRAWPNLYGHIRIGNNCFIGERTTIMYGVTLADNIIVASGSVVCNSFSEQRIIIGGNPARVISTWDKLSEKGSRYAMGSSRVADSVSTNSEMFVERRCK